MFVKQFSSVYNKTFYNLHTNKVFFHSTSTKCEKWDLLTAVCLERKPVITPELDDFQREYKDYVAEVEFELSLKSDYEVKEELEAKQLELLKMGGTDDLDLAVKQTTQDLVDAYTEELSKFKFASRKTEADKTNDLRSLNRKLDKHLILFVNQKIGNKKHYLLPQGLREDGETLRQTAERVLKNSCGDVKAQFYGNAPAGFYKYKYPKGLADGNVSVGAKVFIYFARYKSGQLPDKEVDYKWLDRAELQATLPSDYKDSLSKMLLDE